MCLNRARLALGSKWVPAWNSRRDQSGQEQKAEQFHRRCDRADAKKFGSDGRQTASTKAGVENRYLLIIMIGRTSRGAVHDPAEACVDPRPPARRASVDSGGNLPGREKGDSKAGDCHGLPGAQAAGRGRAVRLVEISGTSPHYESTARQHHHFFFCRHCRRLYNLVAASMASAAGSRRVRSRRARDVAVRPCADCGGKAHCAIA